MIRMMPLVTTKPVGKPLRESSYEHDFQRTREKLEKITQELDDTVSRTPHPPFCNPDSDSYNAQEEKAFLSAILKFEGKFKGMIKEWKDVCRKHGA